TFVCARQGMLEMVVSKADPWLAEYDYQRLVDKALWPLGKQLRARRESDIKAVLTIANHAHLMADQPWIAELIVLRKVYTHPHTGLQSALLHRPPQQEQAGTDQMAR
ncbi:phosphoenolpyruvate carboxylase, partial [Erwinia amylovora]|uniref:phosphoenolpyruvate carboxylase n=1 Tax=Erwinia amylovora TaxID=552 RepID=UPI000FE31FA1